MKRNLLLVIILLVFVSQGFSQDKIITLNNDTIDCKITKVSRKDICFEVTTMGIKTTGKLPLSVISSYSVSTVAEKEEGYNPIQARSLQEKSSQPIQNVPIQAESYQSIQTSSFQRLRLAANGGAGYIFSSSKTAEESMAGLGISPGRAKSYYNNLKTGIYASSDITLMLKPNIGLGLRYKFFDTSASVEDFFDLPGEVNLFYSTYSEHIYVNFAGISFFYSEPLGLSQTFRVYCSYAAGMAHYRNETESLYGNYLITGRSFGMDGSLGLEYFVRPGLSVGAELSAFNSILRKIEVTDGSTTETIELDKENYENLSRFEFSLGIRFYLWNK